MKLPTLSIVVATYNSQKTLPYLLSSIKNQDYPKDKIEIIISDGGSEDKTLSIAKKFGVKVVKPKTEKQGAEINRAYGVHQAKNEILVLFDHDNILPDKNWLVDMVYPFTDNKDIVGAGTLRYHYDASFSLLDRYFALLGISDPLPFYLGKADRSSYITGKYEGPGKVEDHGKYYLVEFNSNKISTLGANGFLVRRKVLMENARVALKEFFHIDVHVDLIKKGFNKYAFVKNTVIHQTHHQDFWQYLARRKLFMEEYHLQDLSKRRYSVFESKKDFWKLLYFIIISLTFVKPTLDSLRGYLKVKDRAWFVHPFMCLGMTLVYGYTFTKWKIKSLLRGGP